tara:strand:+ start:279 stop:626 length:348 start_codon:yes stop_codon:yes gene_type:complete
MSYTIISRLKTSDITNIIGEFNQSIRVFDEKRYKEARKNGSLHYYNIFRVICDKEIEIERSAMRHPHTFIKRIKYWYRMRKMPKGQYLIIPPFYNKNGYNYSKWLNNPAMVLQEL